MSREFIAHSTKMLHFPARLSTSVSLHHDLSLAAFITNIAESDFRYTQPDGLINIPSPGVPPKLDATHKAFLARIVEEGPIPAVHGVVRWRACDLIMRLHDEFGLSVSDDTIYRALKDLGFSHVSARPKAYKQDADAIAAFKKTLLYEWRKSARHSRPARQ